MATPHTHTDPYVRERDVEIRQSSSGPLMLIVGLVLAAAIAIAAWFAFRGEVGPTIVEPGTEQVEPNGGSGTTP